MRRLKSQVQRVCVKVKDKTRVMYRNIEKMLSEASPSLEAAKTTKTTKDNNVENGQSSADERAKLESIENETPAPATLEGTTTCIIRPLRQANNTTVDALPPPPPPRPPSGHLAAAGVQPQLKPCNCRRKGRSHNCPRCTLYYPVSVARSRDADEGSLGYLLKCKPSNSDRKSIPASAIGVDRRANIDENNAIRRTATTAAASAQNVKNKTSASYFSVTPVEVSNNSNGCSSVSNNSSSSSSNSSSSSMSISDQQRSAFTIQLKPSPIPISANLIALLALNKPHGTTFVPPPNKSLAIFQNHHNNNTSTKTTSANNSYKQIHST